MLLQNFVQDSVADNQDLTYYFVIEYCDNISYLTGRTDCYSLTDTESKANDLVV